jgi:hypothetical protein
MTLEHEQAAMQLQFHQQLQKANNNRRYTSGGGGGGGSGSGRRWNLDGGSNRPNLTAANSFSSRSILRKVISVRRPSVHASLLASARKRAGSSVAVSGTTAAAAPAGVATAGAAAVASVPADSVKSSASSFLNPPKNKICEEQYDDADLFTPKPQTRDIPE